MKFLPEDFCLQVEIIILIIIALLQLTDNSYQIYQLTSRILINEFDRKFK